MTHSRAFVLMVLAVLFVVSAAKVAPVVRAGIVCTVQMNELDYPVKVQPGQSFEVDSAFTVTCNQASVAVAGRLDVFDNSSGRVLSTEGFAVGSNPSSPEWSISATIASRLRAPSVNGILPLRMQILLTTGEGTPAFVAGRFVEGLLIQVGEATPESITTAIVIGQNSSASMSYVFISSNASISNAKYDSGSHIITFQASGPNGTSSFTALVFPKYLVDGSPVVLIDNGNVGTTSFSTSSNSTHYLVTFGYQLSEHSVTVGGSGTIPEFTQPLFPFELWIALVAAAVLIRRPRKGAEVK